MGPEEITYLLVLAGIFISVNLSYKKFPKNHEKLYDMLTEEK